MFTNVTTLAARPCESRRSGTAASRLWAAADVSSDLAGGVKAPCPISKLPEIEARTVDICLESINILIRGKCAGDCVGRRHTVH